MLFKNHDLQRELEEDGFVVIPFLDQATLSFLRSFYKQEHPSLVPPQLIDGIHMTTWCEDYEYKIRVAENIDAAVSETTDKYFKDFRTLNHVFIVKESGKTTAFKVHQDWSVIDENQYQSVNVWIPLYDVDSTTGALWVLPKSHRINRKIRGAGCLFPEYGDYINELENAAISVALPAGHAIVFYHSVIHGSPPNLGVNARIAACFGVIPKKAPLCIFYQKDQESELEEHHPSDDFMYQYDNLREETIYRPPTQDPFRTFPPYVNRPVLRDELSVFLPSAPKMSFFDKIKNLFTVSS